MKFKIILFVLLTGIVAQQVPAQVKQDLRVEIEVNPGTDNYYTVSAGSYGLLLFGESDEIYDKERMWDFAFYDTDFKQKAKTSIGMNSRFYYSKHYFDNDKNLYVLFGNRKADEYMLVVANAETRKVTSKTGMVPKKFFMDEFKVYKNTMYLAGNVKSEQFLCSVNLGDMSMTPYPINYEGYNDVKNISISEKDDEVTVVVSNALKRYGVIYIQNFRDGSRSRETMLTPQDGYNLLDGKVSSIGSNEKVVIGTYSIGTGGASGMYFCKLVNNKQQKVTYYNFRDFDNFFKYLPERTQEKIERKMEKQEDKGKEVDLSYSLLVHDLIQRGDDEFLMIAEAYYATYRTETYTSTVSGPNGTSRTVTNTRTVFDGWLYTHAVVAGFNSDGKKLWDNTFEMGDFKTFVLKKRVQVLPHGDEIDLVYGYGLNLRTKTIRSNTVVDKKEYSAVETNNPDDKVRRSTVNDIEYWYDTYFIAYGYQIIKDEDKSKKKRKVFYFTRLNFA